MMNKTKDGMNIERITTPFQPDGSGPICLPSKER